MVETDTAPDLFPAQEQKSRTTIREVNQVMQAQAREEGTKRVADKIQKGGTSGRKVSL